MKLLTVEEVAQRLRVTSETVREMIRRRRLKASKVGKWLVDEEDLKVLLDRYSNFNGEIRHE